MTDGEQASVPRHVIEARAATSGSAEKCYRSRRGSGTMRRMGTLRTARELGCRSRGCHYERIGLDLRTAWSERAASWIRWARDPDLDDDFWLFHLSRFLEFVPSPGAHTLDVAAGEGRLTRELQKAGHRIVGVDSSFDLTRAAFKHPEAAPAVVGDASRLPLADGSVDLAVAFMCLHDFDELESAVAEIHRVLASGGKVVVALLHPFVTGELVGAYGDETTYDFQVERAGLTMNYRGRHRPMGRYLSVLAEQGFGLVSVREVADPRTAPPTVKFLHIAATRQ